MMIMASWILAVASGWRPMACMAPWPIRPSPMPEPMAATPMPSGSPSASAACISIGESSFGFLVSVVRSLFMPVLVVMLVRQHEEDVDRAENGEDHRLQETAEQ